MDDPTERGKRLHRILEGHFHVVGDTHFGLVQEACRVTAESDQLRAYEEACDIPAHLMRLLTPRPAETNAIEPDAVLPDGTMVDWKTAADYGTRDVIVVMGGDLVHTEGRILAHMALTDERFKEVANRINNAIDKRAQAVLETQRPRPEKPKRDWEKRNRKQRRR